MSPKRLHVSTAAAALVALSMAACGGGGDTKTVIHGALRAGDLTCVEAEGTFVVPRNLRGAPLADLLRDVHGDVSGDVTGDVPGPVTS